MEAQIEPQPSWRTAPTFLALTQEKGYETKNLANNRDRDCELPILLTQMRELLEGDERILKKDDEFLAIFLRVRKYDVDRAATNVRDFYVNMAKNQDILRDIRPKQFTTLRNTNSTIFLRARAQNGSKLGLCTVSAWDTSQFQLRQLQQWSTLVVFHMLRQDKATQLNGLSLILDFEGLSLSHVAQLSPKELHRMVISAQGGLPGRLTSIHCINYPPIFWGVYYIIQRFLKSKVRRRIHLHSSLESLHQHFDKENLPESLGGSLTMSEAVDEETMQQLMKENKCAEEFYKT